MKSGSVIRGSIDMDRAFLRIEDNGNGTAIRYKEDDFIMTPNEDASEQTRIHEDQHQFNKLLSLFEAREGQWTMMRRVVESADTPEEAVQKLIHGFVKLERRWVGFDPRARDEILASYKEGQTTEQIYKNLTQLELYDYRKVFKKLIAEVPAYVKRDLKEKISEVFYETVEGEDTAFDAQALEIEESDVQPYIDSVFKDEYEVDLKHWLDSISTLEKKGYAKDEIVALLYQEPVNYWSNLARRMKPKRLEKLTDLHG